MFVARACKTISASRVAFDCLPREWQEYIADDLAPRVERAFEADGPRAALLVIRAEQDFGPDEHAALYSQLPSHIRGAIDKLTKAA